MSVRSSCWIRPPTAPVRCSVLRGAALLEDLDIEFDLSERGARWQRKRPFSKKDGDIPMEVIQDIILSIAGTDDTHYWSGVRVINPGRREVALDEGSFGGRAET